MKKKRLIINHWSSDGNMPTFPEKYSYAKRKWIVDLMYKDEDNRVHEFELIPDQRLRPVDLLQEVRNKLHTIVPSNSTESGFRIYFVRGM